MTTTRVLFLQKLRHETVKSIFSKLFFTSKNCEYAPKNLQQSFNEFRNTYKKNYWQPNIRDFLVQLDNVYNSPALPQVTYSQLTSNNCSYVKIIADLVYSLLTKTNFSSQVDFIDEKSFKKERVEENKDFKKERGSRKKEKSDKKQTKALRTTGDTYVLAPKFELDSKGNQITPGSQNNNNNNYNGYSNIPQESYSSSQGRKPPQSKNKSYETANGKGTKTDKNKIYQVEENRSGNVGGSEPEYDFFGENENNGVKKNTNFRINKDKGLKNKKAVTEKESNNEIEEEEDDERENEEEEELTEQEAAKSKRNKDLKKVAK